MIHTARVPRPAGWLPQLQRPEASDDFAGLAKSVGFRCFVVLRPFAPPALPGFLATTASADFSVPLGSEISPGKVPRLSARAAKLYLMRLSVTVGFRGP